MSDGSVVHFVFSHMHLPSYLMAQRAENLVISNGKKAN